MTSYFYPLTVNLIVILYFFFSENCICISALKVKSGPINMGKKLGVFDFDHTIVEENTDIVARKLIDEKFIPENVRILYRSDGWTQYMLEIFKLLSKHNISSEMVKQKISKQEAVPGMIELITKMAEEHNFDVIIISDSNSLFINWWLQSTGLNKYVHSVFTNPAKIIEPDQISIEMYHYQTDCQLSSKNLCKGKILDEFIHKQATENNIVYDKIVYSGDGKNDLCPILRLGKNDLACVREGYALEKIISKDFGKDSLAKIDNGCENTSDQAHDLKSPVLIWKDGYDILKKIINY